MSTLKPTKKISRRQELRQDTVVTTYTTVMNFIDNNRQLVYGLLGLIIIGLVAIIGFRYNHSQKSARAEMESIAATRLFEEGQYRLALDGIPPDKGLLEIADRYGNTQAGNLAHFYAATALLQLGDMEQALVHFRKFDKSNDFVGASALAGEAGILETQGDYRDAAILYGRAADIYESSIVSPNYLINSGRAYESAGMYTKALEAYRTVKDEYAESSAAEKVDIYIARAEALSKS